MKNRETVLMRRSRAVQGRVRLFYPAIFHSGVDVKIIVRIFSYLAPLLHAYPTDNIQCLQQRGGIMEDKQ